MGLIIEFKQPDEPLVVSNLQLDNSSTTTTKAISQSKKLTCSYKKSIVLGSRPNSPQSIELVQIYSKGPSPRTTRSQTRKKLNCPLPGPPIPPSLAEECQLDSLNAITANTKVVHADVPDKVPIENERLPSLRYCTGCNRRLLPSLFSKWQNCDRCHTKSSLRNEKAKKLRALLRLSNSKPLDVVASPHCKGQSLTGRGDAKANPLNATSSNSDGLPLLSNPQCKPFEGVTTKQSIKREHCRACGGFDVKNRCTTWIFCRTCGDSFHQSCVKHAPIKNHPVREQLPPGCYAPWYWECEDCRQCMSCETSGSTVLTCNDCRKSTCQKCDPEIDLTSGYYFKCNECRKSLTVRCLNCSAPVKVTLKRQLGPLFCPKCTRLDSCPKCNVRYKHEDFTQKMICCTACLKWTHIDCAGITEKQYVKLGNSKDPFFCAACVQQVHHDHRTKVKMDCYICHDGEAEDFLVPLTRNHSFISRGTPTIWAHPKCIKKKSRKKLPTLIEPSSMVADKMIYLRRGSLCFTIPFNVKKRVIKYQRYCWSYCRARTRTLVTIEVSLDDDWQVNMIKVSCEDDADYGAFPIISSASFEDSFKIYKQKFDPIIWESCHMDSMKWSAFFALFWLSECISWYRKMYQEPLENFTPPVTSTAFNRERVKAQGKRKKQSLEYETGQIVLPPPLAAENATISSKEILIASPEKRKDPLEDGKVQMGLLPAAEKMGALGKEISPALPKKLGRPRKYRKRQPIVAATLKEEDAVNLDSGKQLIRTGMALREEEIPPVLPKKRERPCKYRKRQLIVAATFREGDATNFDSGKELIETALGEKETPQVLQKKLGRPRKYRKRQLVVAVPKEEDATNFDSGKELLVKPKEGMVKPPVERDGSARCREYVKTDDGKPLQLEGNYLSPKEEKTFKRIKSINRKLLKVPNFVVARSKIAGLGLYTTRPICDGNRVIEYCGEIVGQLVADRREKLYSLMPLRRNDCYLFRLGRDCIIDATLRANMARFINHSCDPNCESRVLNGHIVINAIRDISAGEELCYDYKFSSEDANDLVACDCGAKTCRKYMN